MNKSQIFYAPVDVQVELIKAMNLICRHVEGKLRDDWKLTIDISSKESTITLFNPEWKTVELESPGSSISMIDEACVVSHEAEEELEESVDSTSGSPKVVGTLCVGKRVFNLHKCDPESVYLHPLESFDVLWIYGKCGILTVADDGELIQKRVRVADVQRSIGRVWVKEVG